MAHMPFVCQAGGHAALPCLETSLQGISAGFAGHLLLARQVSSDVAEPLLELAHGVGARGGGRRVAAPPQQLSQMRGDVAPSNVQPLRQVRECIALCARRQEHA